MSHALGAVKFQDNTIRYYEYDGTADVVYPDLYETPKEVWDNWRKPHSMARCACGRNEDAEVFTSYGGGFYMYGKACKMCNKVDLDPYDAKRLERNWAEGIDPWNR